MKYVAIIRKNDGVCSYVTVLSRLQNDDADSYTIQREVENPYYRGRKYDIENEVWTDEYEELEPHEEPMTLEEKVEELHQKLDEKMDYDLQVNAERDFQLALIKISLAGGGD